MSSIPEWYKGRSILVTGATGFMGKVLVEKLVRSLADIDKIYLLLRPRYGLSANSRIEKLVKLPLFQQLRDNNPQALEKITGIAGDVSLDNLGISEENVKLLHTNVSVVFHIAATVKFEEPLKKAVNINVCGTERLLNLCKGMKKLAVIVHVSTTYCHFDIPVLEEKLYPPTRNPRDIIKLVNSTNDDSLTLITPSLIEPLLNTYAFTKRLTETIVEEYGNQLPIIIARAAIVLPILKEPIPGWVDTLNGPVGNLVCIGKGLIRSYIVPANKLADLIPVDTACNAIIIAAWYRAIKSFTEIPVINLSGSKVHPVTWDELISLTQKEVVNNPFNWPLWYPDVFVTRNKYFHGIIVFLFQTIPAYLIDILLMLAGRKGNMVLYQRKIKQAADAQLSFISKDWNVQTDSFLNISAELCEEDRKNFYTDALKIDQKSVRDFVLGARRFCLKENPKSLPRARKYVILLYYLDRTCKVFIGIAIVWLLAMYVCECTTNTLEMLLYNTVNQNL